MASSLVVSVVKDVYLNIKSRVGHPGLRLSVMLHGGRIEYLKKKNRLSSESRMTFSHNVLHESCKNSAQNGGWCDLPCTHCKRYRRRE